MSLIDFFRKKKPAPATSAAPTRAHVRGTTTGRVSGGRLSHRTNNDTGIASAPDFLDVGGYSPIATSSAHACSASSGSGGYGGGGSDSCGGDSGGGGGGGD